MSTSQTRSRKLEPADLNLPPVVVADPVQSAQILPIPPSWAEVRLLDAPLIRVGNDEYVEPNQSFGLTTLRERHGEVAKC